MSIEVNAGIPLTQDDGAPVSEKAAQLLARFRENKGILQSSFGSTKIYFLDENQSMHAIYFSGHSDYIDIVETLSVTPQSYPQYIEAALLGAEPVEEYLTVDFPEYEVGASHNCRDSAERLLAGKFNQRAGNTPDYIVLYPAGSSIRTYTTVASDTIVPITRDSKEKAIGKIHIFNPTSGEPIDKALRDLVDSTNRQSTDYDAAYFFEPVTIQRTSLDGAINEALLLASASIEGEHVDAIAFIREQMGMR